MSLQQSSSQPSSLSFSCLSYSVSWSPALQHQHPPVLTLDRAKAILISCVMAKWSQFQDTKKSGWMRRLQGSLENEWSKCLAGSGFLGSGKVVPGTAGWAGSSQWGFVRSEVKDWEDFRRLHEVPQTWRGWRGQEGDFKVPSGGKHRWDHLAGFQRALGRRRSLLSPYCEGPQIEQVWWGHFSWQLQQIPFVFLDHNTQVLHLIVALLRILIFTKFAFSSQVCYCSNTGLISILVS